MPKGKYDYETTDVARAGDRLGGSVGNLGDGLYLVMVRMFDTRRMEMSNWVCINGVEQSELASDAEWKETCDKMRSGGIMAAAQVKVTSYWDAKEYAETIGKYNCDGTVLAVRSSHLLRGDGGTVKNAVPGSNALAIAVNREVSTWVDSQDQSKDDAAKDKVDAGLPPIDPPMSDSNAQAIIDGLSTQTDVPVVTHDQSSIPHDDNGERYNSLGVESVTVVDKPKRSRKR